MRAQLSPEQLARQREFVAAARARGPRAFIVRRGVLGFGLPWALAMAAWNYFSDSSDASPWAALRFVHPLAAWIVLMLPFGVLACGRGRVRQGR